MNGIFYLRIIAITRPVLASTVGAVGYQGLTEANETPIASGIPAAVQMRAPAARPAVGVPSDASNSTQWNITIPLGAIAKNSINVRDIVTDDGGIRYQVISPYQTPVGYQLIAERLEA